MGKITFKSINISNLFEIFNYKISFNESDNVLILTGPNGFGKTMVLNIIFNLFNKNLLFFQSLIFEEISVSLTNKTSIIINKKLQGEKINIKFSFFDDKTLLETLDYTSMLETDIARIFQRYLPIRRLDNEKWIDTSIGRILTKEDMLNDYADQLPEELRKNLLQIKSQKVRDILDSIQVHLIREQRLFKKVQNQERTYREDKQTTIIIETIETYSNDLKKLIAEFSQKSFAKTQELDSSYPNRLLGTEIDILPKDEYERQYNILNIKLKKLIYFGLYESKQEVLRYTEEDGKALSVYLKDFQSKLGVFDEILDKLELFTTILNERRFTFKSIYVHRDFGFFFKTVKGKDLQLNQLSSGEQHEVVLLYELIFNVKEDVLVLIDEPEISLHITWQKEFLNDLLKIIELQNIQVIVATHSPSIIGERWDLVKTLRKEDVI